MEPGSPLSGLIPFSRGGITDRRELRDRRGPRDSPEVPPRRLFPPAPRVLDPQSTREEPMLKSDLVQLLIHRKGLQPRQAARVVELFFDALTAALARGENIEIRGLGSFHVKHYDGYRGRNPKTSEIIEVKPKRGVLFRTGKELRDRLNGAKD